jgi:hypothetical protein
VQLKPDSLKKRKQETLESPNYGFMQSSCRSNSEKAADTDDKATSEVTTRKKNTPPPVIVSGVNDFNAFRSKIIDKVEDKKTTSFKVNNSDEIRVYTKNDTFVQ